MDYNEWDNLINRLLSMPYGTKFSYTGFGNEYECETVDGGGYTRWRLRYSIISTLNRSKLSGIYGFDTISGGRDFPKNYVNNVKDFNIRNQHSIKNFLTKVREGV